MIQVQVMCDKIGNTLISIGRYFSQKTGLCSQEKRGKSQIFCACPCEVGLCMKSLKKYPETFFTPLSDFCHTVPLTPSLIIFSL